MYQKKVIKISSWIAPKDGITGAKLLTMPNIPLPLHGLNPRSIYGKEAWDKIRLGCYEHSGHRCEACGRCLEPNKFDAHEMYTFRYSEGLAIFSRLVCLCRSCHMGIHSGRTFARYKEGEISKAAYLKIIEKLFRNISEYNNTHLNEKPLRVYRTILSQLDDPTIGEEIKVLIDRYDIEFYGEEHFSSVQWRDWQLSWCGQTFRSLYKTKQDWRNAKRLLYTPNNTLAEATDGR
jgi:hypothetical protein